MQDVLLGGRRVRAEAAGAGRARRGRVDTDVPADGVPGHVGGRRENGRRPGGRPGVRGETVRAHYRAGSAELG